MSISDVPAPSDTPAQRSGLMIHLDTLLKWKRFILLNTLGVGILALIVSLLLPKWYKATASILTPKDQSFLNLFGGTSSVLKSLSGFPKLGGLSQNTGAYNYFAILKSRTCMEAIARKFNLPVVYDISDTSMEKTLKELQDNVAFELQDDDYITIDVYDKDPARAAAMANFFVSTLNEMSVNLGTQEARSNREFIERRLTETRDTLKNAEELLKQFQQKVGMIISPEQSSSVSAVADLYATKAKKEIELAILERKVTPDNEMLRQLRLELAELDKKVATFPQAGLETYRLYRDVATQQKILEVLIPLYEQARVNEQKDVPVLLVLDQAVPPQKKIRPQRSLIVLVSVLLFLFASVAGVLGMDGVLRRNAVPRGLTTTLRNFAARMAAIYRVPVAG